MKNGTHEPDWKMPKVEKGQVVYWYPSRMDKIPTAAVVIAVGEQTVNLALHTHLTKDHIFRDGVHHKDDPWLLLHAEHAGGSWTLTPRDEAINEMLAAFEAKKAAARVAPSLAGSI